MKHFFSIFFLFILNLSFSTFIYATEKDIKQVRSNDNDSGLIFLPPNIREQQRKINFQKKQKKVLQSFDALPSNLQTELQGGDIMNLPQSYLTIPDFNISEKDKKENNWDNAIQDSINAAKAHGGGVIRILAHPYHLNKSLTIPSGVIIEGGSHLGDTNIDNPAYGLILEKNQTLTLEKGSALRHIAILPAYINSSPTDNDLKKWSGYAITIGHETQESPHDILLDDLFITGFNNAIYIEKASRLHISNIHGDNLNGLSIEQCDENCMIRDVQWAPYSQTNILRETGFSLKNTDHISLEHLSVSHFKSSYIFNHTQHSFIEDINALGNNIAEQNGIILLSTNNFFWIGGRIENISHPFIVHDITDGKIIGLSIKGTDDNLCQTFKNYSITSIMTDCQ